MWLLTAGPTREYLDSVRFLSNASSGRMGYAIAAEAARRGQEVILVSGPVPLECPTGVLRIEVVSATEMLAAASCVLDKQACDVLFAVAAVADFRPRERVAGKPAKGESPRQLELIENPDVLACLVAKRRVRLAYGFALEDVGCEGNEEASREAQERARRKLMAKGIDAIVLNALESMEGERARAWWLPRQGPTEALGLRSKDELAAVLVAKILASAEKS